MSTKLTGNHKKYWNAYKKAFIRNEPGIENLTIDNDEIKIFKEGENLLIIFKGSDNQKDIKDNIKFCKKDKTHEGFNNIASNIELSLFWIINKYKPTIIKLIGYSKGGALALELSERFCRYYPDKLIRVYTYGQPAIWTKEKINQLPFKLPHFSPKFKYYRIYFQRDIVVHILNFIYKHPVEDFNINKIKLKSKWWHWLPFAGIKVHLSYNNYYNNYYNNNRKEMK